LFKCGFKLRANYAMLNYVPIAGLEKGEVSSNKDVGSPYKAGNRRSVCDALEGGVSDNDLGDPLEFEFLDLK
jgi:hypothetical protein